MESGIYEENESVAWNALVPLVIKLREFYDFSKKLNVIVPKILVVLCSDNDENRINVSNSK